MGVRKQSCWFCPVSCRSIWWNCEYFSSYFEFKTIFRRWKTKTTRWDYIVNIMLERQRNYSSWFRLLAQNVCIANNRDTVCVCVCYSCCCCRSLAWLHGVYVWRSLIYSIWHRDVKQFINTVSFYYAKHCISQNWKEKYQQNILSDSLSLFLSLFISLLFCWTKWKAKKENSHTL